MVSPTLPSTFTVYPNGLSTKVTSITGLWSSFQWHCSGAACTWLRRRPLNSCPSGHTHDSSLLSHLSPPSAVSVTVSPCWNLKKSCHLHQVRTVLRAQGQVGLFSTVLNREGREDWSSRLPSFLTQKAKERRWTQRASGRTHIDGEWEWYLLWGPAGLAQVCPGAPSKLGSGLLF